MTIQAQIAKAIRQELKELNIDAIVKSFVSCGVKSVRVSTTGVDIIWIKEEAKKIGDIAKSHNLTGVYGTPILGINTTGQEFEVRTK